MSFRSVCISFALVALILSGFGCVNTTLQSSALRAEHIGNTSGNIHNDGLIVSAGEWVYYTDTNNNDRLYKCRLDGSEKQELVNQRCYCLNFIDDRIYYTNGLPGKVFAIHSDGSNNELLINKPAGNLLVTDRNIFFILSYDNDWGKLYRTDLSGKNELLLVENCKVFSISDEWIYYADRNDHDSIYKIDMNGNRRTKLNDAASSSVNADGEYVYYTVHDGGKDQLYRMCTNGTQKTLLSEDSCWDLNVFGEYLYYRNNSKQGMLYRMKADGSEKLPMSERKNCTNINVTDSVLMYYVPESTGGYFITTP